MVAALVQVAAARLEKVLEEALVRPAVTRGLLQREGEGREGVGGGGGTGPALCDSCSGLWLVRVAACMPCAASLAFHDSTLWM